MRAKFGINGTESMGEIGKVCWNVGAVSVRHGKVSDSPGMNYDFLVEFPNPDVADS